MDAEAIRYYLPALMVAVLSRDEESDWWPSISCFSILENQGDMAKLLNDHQKRAVSRFILDVPKVVDLDVGEERQLRRAAPKWC